MLPQMGQTSLACGTQFDRVGISAADTNTSDLPTYSCQGLSVTTVAALCDTASATITLRMIYFNASSLPCGTSVAVIFTSGQTADFGQLFMGTPDSDLWRPIAGATSIGIKVDTVSGGRWSLHGSAG